MVSIPTSLANVAIVGAGQAGAVAATTLRTEGFSGRIVLIGDEPHLPYERPPLSKDALVKPKFIQPSIFSEAVYAEYGIECRLGQAVTQLDLKNNRLILSSEERISFDKLLITTGSRVRRYPLLDRLGADVYSLRTLDDAASLRDRLVPGKRILIVGGGVIGLEVASSATSLGAKVTVLEKDDRLLRRAVPGILAAKLLTLHKKHGVHFEFSIEMIDAVRAGTGEIQLLGSDGRRHAGDIVVYGIGTELNVELALSAGLKVDDGILTDAYGRTSHSSVYAAGDVARQWWPSLGAYVRQETWANAQSQAVCVAKSLVRDEPCVFDVPWFWTDQYNNNFQIAGAREADRWILRGPEDKQTLFGITGGVVRSVITINNGREMRPAKAMIANSHAPDDLESLGDLSVDLRRLIT
jgi:3-phenylpropionate/trans-cinnamate dioxygenase ferredoxin reductase subunit